MMKILLAAINAKYIHSNLAIYNLRAFAKEYGRLEDCEIELGEYTINQQTDEILMDIYRRKPDMLAFSCYIWNIEYVRRILVEIHKLMPEVPIWLGGPEVSYCGVQMLEELPQVTGVMVAEGEETFTELAEYYSHIRNMKNKEHNEHDENETKDKETCQISLSDIKGIIYRVETKRKNEEQQHHQNKNQNQEQPENQHGEIVTNTPRTILDLTTVPFVYHEIEEFKNKIIYYESSRGCPFSCSYCLSSIDKKLRFRDTEVVLKELAIFLKHGVKQVKFVDRTFNCNHKHSMAIWQFIKEHDNGITNFHFEIAADLITEEEIALIGTMRKGLIQLEIGVQSTHLDTIHEIKRVMDFGQVTEVVKKIQAAGNIHQHLDLIAGLPFETYEIFRKSFDEVYALRPEQLQLGFLKVLKGSYMYQQQENYGLVYQSKPPYEVLYTNWLSYEEVLRLKGVEDMVEVYYNSGQFVTTMELLEKAYDSAFDLYEEMSKFYDERNYRMGKHTRVARYEILHEFIESCEDIHKEDIHKETNLQETMDVYYDALMKDLYLRENAKTRPKFAKEYSVDKQFVRAFFEKEEEERNILVGYEKYDKRQMSKMTHIEVLGGKHVLFDYQNRNPLTNEATTYVLEEYK